MPAFENKTALVTGSGRGIGRATAKLLAACGATVIVNDVNEDAAAETVAIIRDSGGQAVPGVADITAPGQVERLFADVRTAHGGVDILVNNAGGAPPGASWQRVADASIEDWVGFLNLNLVAAFTCARLAIPAMLERGRGHIVCVGSISGTYGQVLGSGYAAAKAGLTALVASIAKEYGSDGISCNGIVVGNAPHPTRTAERQAQLDSYVHLARVGGYDEFAAAVAFLCSEESSYMSGAMMPVDGGFHRFNLL
jgi:NAD(P)-dependent dehydrogenase (short-subunit alcohol dehydrogenase family)